MTETNRAARERQQRVELRRLKAALSTIHDRLHAGDVDGAHEQCECALAGETISQPNISAADAAQGMDFAAAFNALIERHHLRACCIALVPSKTVRNAVSLQLCGEVQACKIIETALRGGNHSLYMGDHAEEVVSRGT
jgi:hypothetical protein